MKITFNGKPLKAGDIEKALMKGATKLVAQEMRERFSAIRHPATGEFPTVIVLGDSLNDMSLRVEGSPELLAIIRQQMSQQDLQGVDLQPIATGETPRAFLSYGGEDEALAKRIAHELMAKGIDVWFAPWSITAGDAWRRQIESGIDRCTDFIALLTPTSIEKPWVQTEIDAGFIKRVENKCRFIGLRSGLSVEALPLLLRTLHSPAIENFEEAIAQLVSDIHRVSRKPPLGPAPTNTKAAEGYSLGATAIAEYFVRNSKTAMFADPQTDVAGLAQDTGLTTADVRDALHELRAFFGPIQFDHVLPREGLFVEFDGHFLERSVADDALRLASDLHNDAKFPTSLPMIAERYGWDARRLNPVVVYLVERDLVFDRRAFGTQPWISPSITRKPDQLRRFVKSRT